MHAHDNSRVQIKIGDTAPASGGLLHWGGPAAAPCVALGSGRRLSGCVKLPSALLPADRASPLTSERAGWQCSFAVNLRGLFLNCTFEEPI